MKHEVRMSRQRGFTLTEVVLVLAAAVILIGLGVYIYRQRVEPALWANSKYNLVLSIIAGIEQAKASRGGVYPAYSGPLSNPNNPIYPYLASTGSANDLVGVNYSCPPGTGVTLTVSFPFSDSENLRGKFQLREKLQSANFNVQTNRDTLTIELNGVNCN